MLSSYLPNIPNETWKAVTGRNSSNEPTTATPKQVSIFWRGTVKVLTTEQGEQVAANVEGMTTEPVKMGDLITWEGREWPVIGSVPAVGLGGREMYRRIYI